MFYIFWFPNNLHLHLLLLINCDIKTIVFKIICSWNWQSLKWHPMPDKMAGSSLRQTLQVCVNTDTQKVQSSDWPKWCCMLWHNVNSCVFVGHRVSFQQVCRYVNSWIPDLTDKNFYVPTFLGGGMGHIDLPLSVNHPSQFLSVLSETLSWQNS